MPEREVERALTETLTPTMAVEQPEPLIPKADTSITEMPKPKPYDELNRILGMAFQQAATGKGRERHAASPIGTLPWHLQPIMANARQIGPGGPAMQVMKKAGESVTMAGNMNFTGAKAEALGAIVYAAALYKLYEEMERANT